jgi:hypothetical protein
LIDAMIREVRADKPNMTVFLEKTPGNALCVREIRMIYPRAKIILITRDPSDVLASWRRSADTWAPWLNTDPKWVAEMITTYTDAIADAPGFVPADQLRVISYEELYAEPAATLAMLGEFIGVPFSTHDIDTALAHTKPSALQKGGGVPIHRYGAAAQQYGPVVDEPQGFFGAARPAGSRGQMSLRNRWWMTRTRRELSKRVRAGAHIAS